jgi:hypothetical protein
MVPFRWSHANRCGLSFVRGRAKTKSPKLGTLARIRAVLSSWKRQLRRLSRRSSRIEEAVAGKRHADESVEVLPNKIPEHFGDSQPSGWRLSLSFVQLPFS